MPLSKGPVKKSGQNQGAQWGDTGSPGNIKHHSSGEHAGGPGQGPSSSKHARDKSIGKGRKPRMKDVNPE